MKKKMARKMMTQEEIEQHISPLEQVRHQKKISNLLEK